jgi:hypothetical protein
MTRFDFAAALARNHRIVHDTLSLEALYYDRSMAAPVALRVRWHFKQAPVGDIENQGYPMYLDLVERVIFDKAELALNGITIVRGGRVQITAPGFSGYLAVDVQSTDNVGPVNEAWSVGKLQHGNLTA